MKMTAKELADVLNGTVEGNPETVVTSFGKIEHGKPGQLNFYANPKYEQYVYTTKASIILVNRDFQPAKPLEATLVRVDDTYSALAQLLNHVASERKSYKCRRGLCLIALSARIGRRVNVGHFVTIGAHTIIGEKTRICNNVTIGKNVKIGSKCIIYPGVHIFDNTVIGNNVILHSGCIIGDDGFGNAPQPDGTWKKIEHLGNVVIGNDVEIGSNTTVDRAPMESTIIGNGVRIDNLCQIAHNVQIGDNTVMAAQTGIAGSTIIGKNCILAGQVGIVGHVKIADNTTIGAKSGIIGNVRKSGSVLFGIPALDRVQYLKAFAKFKASAED